MSACFCPGNWDEPVRVTQKGCPTHDPRPFPTETTRTAREQFAKLKIERLTAELAEAVTHALWLLVNRDDDFSIARTCAFSEPVAIGWSSNGDHPMSHDAPLTERQFSHLLNCGVLRSNAEVAAIDALLKSNT